MADKSLHNVSIFVSVAVKYRAFHNVLRDYKHFNKKTKETTLMELYTATRKLKQFFLQLEMFDVCHVTRGAHIEHL